MSSDEVLAELALKRKWVTPDQLAQAQQDAVRESQPLAVVLVKKRLLSSAQLASLLREQQREQQVTGEGTALGRFRLNRKLGEGSMGEVWLAEDASLARPVALKLLSRVSASDIERFTREARLAARLTHPNIIQVYEMGYADGRHYIAMQYIEGAPPAPKEGGTRRILEIVADVAAAVQYAHDHGIIHRDIKPGNILVARDGRVYLGDFGLAKAAESMDLSTSQTGTLIGTPAYMSPEQARGDVHAINKLSDVYALGATLYYLLSGRDPFVGTTLLEVLPKVANEDPPPLRRLDPSLHPDLETIVLKAMEKEPSRRYQSAGELADDIRRFLNGEAIQARPASLLYRIRKQLARRRRLLIGTSLAALVAVIAVLAAVVNTRNTQQTVDEYTAALQNGMETWGKIVSLTGRAEFDPHIVQQLADQSIASFQKAARILPHRPEPWLMIGRCYQVKRQGADAERAWTKAVTLDPQFVLARFERGKYYLSEYLKVRRAPSVHSSHGRVRLGPADPESDQDRHWHTKAMLDIEAARKQLTGHSPEMDYLRGILLYGEGSYREAEEVLARYTAANPWDAAAVAVHGYTLYFLGHFEKARSRLDHALMLEKRSAWLKARGDVHYCMGRFQAALADYEEAFGQAPSDPEVVCNRGLAHQALGNLAQAEADYTEAIRLRPTFARAYNNRGTARAARQDLEGAVEDFEKAAFYQPAYAEAYNNKGNALVMLGEIDKALEEYDLALEFDPNYVECYANRGIARRIAGNLAGAIEDFRKVIEKIPSHHEARIELAKTLREAGRPQEALEELHKVLQTAPPDSPPRQTAQRLLEAWSKN